MDAADRNRRALLTPRPGKFLLVRTIIAHSDNFARYCDMRRLMPAAAAVLLSISTPAFADALEDALNPYFKGDYVTAFKLLQPLADNGIASAQYFLGVMYDEGSGVPRDRVQAAVWLRKAAEQDNGGAQFKLAFMYLTGDGVPQDLVLAYMWLNLVATTGDAGAAAYRDSVAGRMSPAQIAEAQRLAREWKPKRSQ
jgi:TPR repeat protein